MGRRNRIAKTTQNYIGRKPDRKWNTAIYARLSTVNNGLEDERSLENQIRYIENYIKKFPNMKLINRYVDNGYSGTSFERPQFICLMEDVKSGNIDCIVVKDLSRFGRNFLEVGYYLEKIFPRLNVRLIAINDNYDSFDPAKKDSLTVPIKNLVNEIYAKDTTEKVVKTFRAKEKKGEIIYGFPPYGYVKDENNPFRLIIDKSAEPYVKQIFSWAMSGIRISEIMHRLNDAKVPTPKMNRKRSSRQDLPKKKWFQNTVRRILINPTYLGDTFYGGRCGADFITANSVGKKKISKNNIPRAQWRVIPNTHEPLVSREDFEKANENIDRNGKNYRSKADGRKEQREALPNILKGKFFCKECGRTMQYSRYFRGSGSRYRDYCCSGYKNSRSGLDMNSDETPLCRKERFSIDDRLCRTLIFGSIQLQIEAGVQLEKLAMMRTKAYNKKRAELNKAVRMKEIEVENVKAKLQKLYEDYRKKIIHSNDYLIIRQRYLEKQETTKTELDRLRIRLLDVAEKINADRERKELKRMIAEISIQATQAPTDNTDCVEVISDDTALIPGTEKLTKELLDEMIERIEYGADKALHITFKHTDWVAVLADKLNEGVYK